MIIEVRIECQGSNETVYKGHNLFCLLCAPRSDVQREMEPKTSLPKPWLNTLPELRCTNYICNSLEETQTKKGKQMQGNKGALLSVHCSGLITNTVPLCPTITGWWVEWGWEGWLLEKWILENVHCSSNLTSLSTRPNSMLLKISNSTHLRPEQPSKELLSNPYRYSDASG